MKHERGGCQENVKNLLGEYVLFFEFLPKKSGDQLTVVYDCFSLSVPDCFGPGIEMVMLITISVLHDSRFGPAINCSHHLGLIIAVKGFIVL